MYLQITTKCNMACSHCCWSCRPGAGENMSVRTFRKALRLAHGHSERLFIGGGEPTVHPQFEKLLLLALSSGDPVSIITNGKRKNRALMLARLATVDALNVALSRDEFHATISQEVVKAFEDRTVPRLAVNSVRRPLYYGRYLQSSKYDKTPANEPCVCPEWFVRPDGTISVCGCPDSEVIGDCRTGITCLCTKECGHNRG